MPTWRATLTIKDLLTPDDVEPQVAREKGREVAKRLKESHVFVYAVELMLVTFFEDINDQEEFNDYMEMLYDCADDERVWIA